MKIALTFSGGGYRAAAYDLGVLTYLEQVQIEGKPLLNEVIALSTVSGGTITGARYALGIKQGESLNSIYHALYDFFTHTDLITESIKRLNSTERWNGRIKSLINSFADTYDTTLFDRKKFGTLLREDPPIHLHHISFNATEFTTALQFRFQISDEVSNAGAGKRMEKAIHQKITYLSNKYSCFVHSGHIGKLDKKQSNVPLETYRECIPQTHPAIKLRQTI